MKAMTLYVSVVLDDHSRYHQSWDWLSTYELASGSGVGLR